MSAEMPRITGGYWAHQPRGLRDIARCLLGLHRAAMSGDLGYGEHVDRCTCGAIQMGMDGYWSHVEYRWHRVSRKESVRLLAADRQRDEQYAEMRQRWAEMAAAPADPQEQNHA